MSVGSALIGLDAKPTFAQRQQQDDPILAHITKEAARVARAFQDRPRADDYRALAINNHLFATYVRSQRLDGVVKTHMTQLVRQRGRHALVERAMGQEMADHRRHFLGTFGVHVHTESIPADVYEGQLDVILLKGGLAEILDATAVTLDAMFTRMEKIMASNGVRVVPVQSQVEQQLRCGYLMSQCNSWSAYAGLFCVGAYWGTFLSPLCWAATASMAGYCGSAQYYGCY